MKAIFVALLALVVAVGCGKKEPELSTEKVITPDQAANKLYVEAVKLISGAERKSKADLKGAIADYNLALSKIDEISEKYPESNLAVKLVSDELVFSGKTQEMIKERFAELKAEQAKFQRLLAERKKAEALKEQERVRLIARQKQMANNYGKFDGTNLRNLAVALVSYLGDNDGRYPPSDKWSDSLAEYWPGDDLKQFLEKDKQSGLSLMYNSGIGEVHEVETYNSQPNTVVFFLSKNGGWNQSGGADEAHNHSWARKAKNINLMSFADGHAEFFKLTPESRKRLIWEIKPK